MGQLKYLSDLYLDARWYFPDAYYNRERNNYSFQWPNDAYPHNVAIHNDDIINNILIEIRKWIEKSLDGLVICNMLDKSYRRYIGERKDWDNSYEVPNKWVVFYFDNEQSALMFALRFSEWIRPITDEHPRWL